MLRIPEHYLGGQRPRGVPVVRVGCHLLDAIHVSAEQVKDVGVDGDVNFRPGVTHVRPDYPPVLPEGRQAVADAGEFMPLHTG